MHIVERLGKYHKSVEQGLYTAVPVIDRIIAVVDLLERIVPIECGKISLDSLLHQLINKVISEALNHIKSLTGSCTSTSLISFF